MLKEKNSHNTRDTSLRRREVEGVMRDKNIRDKVTRDKNMRDNLGNREMVRRKDLRDDSRKYRKEQGNRKV